jgi:hypothetical protein
MRFLVGYTVWNKIDHLVWLLEGIIENFDPSPDIARLRMKHPGVL